jgi:hypothetical protein
MDTVMTVTRGHPVLGNIILPNGLKGDVGVRWGDIIIIMVSCKEEQHISKKRLEFIMFELI